MSESEKSSSNMPTVLVVILAMLGLATFPQGGGKLSDSSPKALENAGSAGPPRNPSDDEKRLGPLATIKAHRVPIPPATQPDPCRMMTEPLNDIMKLRDQDRDKILLSEPDLRFLIALVPDPEGTSMSHEFDLTLSAVQRGTESAGFVAVRWSGMPGFPPTKGPSAAKPAATRIKVTAGQEAMDLTIEDKTDAQDPVPWPASVLCRPTPAADEGVQKTHLLILLVPESPTWGVDKARLASAVALVARHRDLHKSCKHPTDPDFRVRILGPNFSGSVRSMIEVLKPFAERPDKSGQTPGIVVYNGRAGAVKPKSFEGLPPDSIRFQSTTYTNNDLNTAIREFIKKITPWVREPRFAILNESNTGFGQSSYDKNFTDKNKSTEDESTTDYFSFPLNISQIREEYASKGYLKANEPLKLQSPERLTPLEMAGPRDNRDLVPVVTPAESAVSGEMNLSQLLMALRRGHYTWVGITSTNPYDRLFLAERVRVACPDVRLFFVIGSTFYSHPTVVPYLRGTLVASTYPLDPDTQSWTASPGSSGVQQVSRVAFGNYFEEGIYNATVAHLADMKLDQTPNFLDYAYPGRAPTEEDERVPSVWIGVVGQHGIYPLSVRHPARGWLKAPNEEFPNVGGLYRPGAKKWALPQIPPARVFDDNWVGLFLAAAFASIIVSAWYLRSSLGVETESAPRWSFRWWLRWGSVCPGLRQVLDHHSSRKVATVGASAGFGLMVLLSAPVWVLVMNRDLFGSDPFHHALLMGLAALACLGLGVATVVALTRMLRAGGAGAVGLGETVYRVLAAVVTVAQMTLPVCMLAALLIGTDAAGLRLFGVRATRLVNGVTPIVPMLLLGLTGGTIMLGDWRRIGLRIRMSATGESKALDSSPLAEVWTQFQKARGVLDYPLTAWGETGFGKFLPLWLVLSLVGIGACGLPTAVEPYRFFLAMFLLAFGVTLVLLVVRMVDLFGLSRELDLLLRRLAETPMVRAFARVPAHFVHENFWRPSSSAKRAEDDSDPRLDTQFGAVVVGYETNRAAIRNDVRLWSVDAAGLETLSATNSPSAKLRTSDWWPAVGALVPFLAPYWAARTAILNDPADAAGEWTGLTDDGLKRWLRAAEDLIALVMVRQIAWLRAAVNSILSFLVVGLVMMTLVLTSYPFEPQGPLFGLLGALTVITLGAIVVIAVQASRDEVLSRLNKTVTDRFTFDRQFLTMIVTFAMPLLGLLGALSYSLSDLFRSLLEPFFRAG